MQTSPLGSAQGYIQFGADGGGEEGSNSFPLGATGVRNSRHEMNTGAGQVVEAPERQRSSNCLDTCVCWFMNCLSKEVEVVEEDDDEAETLVAAVTSQPEAQGATGLDDSQAKAEKTIPKPDARGEKVDLEVLASKDLYKLPLKNAVGIATEALENAKKTACFEYWAYEEQKEPKDRAKVDEAQLILEKTIKLVRSFIAQEMKLITDQSLTLLSLLADECKILHAQIAENLSVLDAAGQAIKAEESVLGCVDNQAFELTTEF